MTKVLVVDDSAMDRHLVGSLLEREPGYEAAERRTGLTAVYAGDGREAVEVIRRESPQIVVTDLVMPVMNGLELVDEVRREFPGLPVVVVTAHGSEDIAFRALQHGAAGYVPKRRLADDLLEVVRDVLGVATARRVKEQALRSISEADVRFVLENDPALITPLVAYVDELLTLMDFCDAGGRIRVGIALREAVLNAIYHGNLEVPGSLQDEDPDGYTDLVARRLASEPYSGRRVHVGIRQDRSESVIRVRDQGAGFDPASLPDPTDPENLTRIRGRGVLLIRTFMDETSWAEGGRELTMVKRKAGVGN